MSHLDQALQLKKDFPEETKGFSVFEVERIWENYSERLAAGWITPDKESVKSEFEKYRS